MGTKMKGLLKGLRYISQIFDEEKEKEMQIGFPTDVKHVAHIGSDGPSMHSPSWMTSFKSTPEFSSSVAGDQAKENTPPTKLGSEDSSRRSIGTMESPGRDLPELPISSRRQSPSPNREKTEKSKHSRRQLSESDSSTGSSTKKDRSSEGSTRLNRRMQDTGGQQIGNESPSHLSLPGIPQKSRRKKSKDSSVGGSTRSKGTINPNMCSASHTNNNNNISSSYKSPFSDPGPGSRSIFTNNNIEPYQSLTLQAFEEREEKNKLSVTGLS